jgi:hypothetical protein
MRKSLSKEELRETIKSYDVLELNKNKSENLPFTSQKDDSEKFSDDEKIIKKIKQEMIITKSKFQNEAKKQSIWKDFSSGLTNLKNNIKYNTIVTNTLFELHTQDEIQIFNKKIETYKDNFDLKYNLYYIIYMTYRSEFKGITGSANNNFTTDCGWGCMLRCAQMMLANAFFRVKEFEFIENFNTINDIIKKDLIKKTLALFLDSPIPYEQIKNNRDFNKVLIKLSKDIELANDDIMLITPPFSIQNICKFGKLMDKEAGEWYSDINMSGIFSYINTEFQPIDNLEIITFKEGVIYQSDLISACFELTEECPEDKTSVILFNEKSYKFKNKGIIFLSLRLGLDKLETQYIKHIPKFFNIPNNLGIISGKAFYAYYFIGVSNGKLLYLDPHFNRKSISFSELEQQYKTYLQKEIYLLDVKCMSPALTVCFYFNSFYEYIELVSAFKYFSHQEELCFKFEDVRSEFVEGNYEYTNTAGNDFEII